MKRRVWIIGSLLALLPALVQAELYVLIDGIPGNVTLESHRNWHQGISFNWSYEKSNTEQPFKLQALLAQRTASLGMIKQAAFNGASIKRIVFDQVRAPVPQNAPLVTTRLTCESAVISALTFQVGYGDLPSAQLQLGCAKVSWDEIESMGKHVKGEAVIQTKTP